MSFNEYSVYFDHLKSLAAAFVGISDAKTVHGLFFEAQRGDLSALDLFIPHYGFG